MKNGISREERGAPERAQSGCPDEAGSSRRGNRSARGLTKGLAPFFRRPEFTGKAKRGVAGEKVETIIELSLKRAGSKLEGA